MRLQTTAFIMAALAGSSNAATFTVSKDGRGEFTSIQAAVDKAHSGDEVVILDTATYSEQVTLGTRLHHFTLRSANPSASRKPVIRWSDMANLGPKTCQESLDLSNVTFDKNGALRLMEVRDVRIQGITIDGGAQKAYAYPSVWGNGTTCNGALYPLFFGNAGLVIFRSSHVVVLDCEFTNAFFGVSIKDRDAQGPFGTRGNPVFDGPPFSRMATGNHFFEGNSIHDNTWGVFMESAWGSGSTFRDNLIYENHHPTPAEAAAVKSMPDGANQPGGAFLFKDVQSSPMTLQNNTLWRNFLNLAGGFRAGAQHLIANNLIAEPNVAWAKDPNFYNHFMSLDPYFPKRMQFNAYAGQSEAPALDSVSATAGLFDTVTQQQVQADKPVYFANTVRIMNAFPVLMPDTASTLIDVPLSMGVEQVRVSLPSAVYQGAVFKGGSAPYDFPAAARNRWVETKFQSLQPSNPGFLSPVAGFREFLNSAGSPLRHPAGSGAASIVGALTRSERPQAFLRIVPLAPVLVEEGQMVLRFSVQALSGDPASGGAPVIAYLRLEKNLPVNPNSFGGGPVLQLKEAEAIPVPAAALRYGYNELKLPQSGLSAEANANGFVEMAVAGMGTLSNVATFPIIPLTSLFTVEALDETQDIPAAGFAKGKTFRIRVAYAKNPAVAYPVRISLASGAPLKFVNPGNADSSGSIASPLPFTGPVQFTETPDDGVELIWASAYPDSLGMVTGFGQTRALVFDAPPTRLNRGRNRVSPKPADILKRRNVLGRKVGLKSP